MIQFNIDNVYMDINVTKKLLNIMNSLETNT